MTTNPEPDDVVVLEEYPEMTMGALSVNVDFNDLLSDRGEAEAFDLIGKLKDLLG